MKTIAVVCEKGCTGKSVIATELYESYVRQGLRASLYSLDCRGAAASAVLAMCRKVSHLAGLPFEKKQLKKIATR